MVTYVDENAVRGKWTIGRIIKKRFLDKMEKRKTWRLKRYGDNMFDQLRRLLLSFQWMKIKIKNKDYALQGGEDVIINS